MNKIPKNYVEKSSLITRIQKNITSMRQQAHQMVQKNDAFLPQLSRNCSHSPNNSSPQHRTAAKTVINSENKSVSVSINARCKKTQQSMFDNSSVNSNVSSGAVTQPDLPLSRLSFTNKNNPISPFSFKLNQTKNKFTSTIFYKKYDKFSDANKAVLNEDCVELTSQIERTLMNTKIRFNQSPQKQTEQKQRSKPKNKKEFTLKDLIPVERAQIKRVRQTVSFRKKFIALQQTGKNINRYCPWEETVLQYEGIHQYQVHDRQAKHSDLLTFQ